jgi:kynurenine formamidase
MKKWGCWSMTSSAGQGKWLFLSHPLDAATPAYGSGMGLSVTVERSMVRGDCCNATRWDLSAHLGSHVDLPRHFSPDGPSVDAYPAGFWIFGRIALLVTAEVSPETILGWDEIGGKSLPDDIELLLIRTGWSGHRSERVYREANPGLAPQLADQLRERCPDLRAVGFDFISVSSFASRELGREAHRAFLDHRRPLLLLEDLDLSGIDGATTLRQVIVAPLRVAGADGAPCTVFAEVVE